MMEKDLKNTIHLEWLIENEKSKESLRFYSILNSLENELEKLVEEGFPAKLIKLKRDQIEAIKDYTNKIIFEITSFQNQNFNLSIELEELRNNTQTLVTYCELRGLDPNDIFILTKNHPKIQDKLKEMLDIMLDEKTNRTRLTFTNISLWITSVEIIKSIRKGLLDMSKYFPNTPEFNTKKNQIINDCSQSIFKA